MAAVPPGQMRPDPDKETIGSLMVIREILDRASDVDEAVAILQSYNIRWGGGPPLHYLIADSSGRSVLVEFYQGEMVIIPNKTLWHLATNFLRASAGESAEGRCWRYDRISQRLTEAEGQITTQDAIDLLAEVSQEGTQWSIVYGMSTGDVSVTMGRQYDKLHTFHLSFAALLPVLSVSKGATGRRIAIHHHDRWRRPTTILWCLGCRAPEVFADTINGRSPHSTMRSLWTGQTAYGWPTTQVCGGLSYRN
jgi:hypothetical protein